MTIPKLETAISRVRKQLRDYPPNPENYRYMYKELATRYLLIDPIVRALDWDMSDFDQSAVEWPMPEGQIYRQADYVLFGPDDNPVIVIEAKSLRVGVKNRPSGMENQLAAYCKGMNNGTAVITNGIVWHLYQLDGSRKAFKNKHSAEVDIRQGYMSIADSAHILHEHLDKSNWW